MRIKVTKPNFCVWLAALLDVCVYHIFHIQFLFCVEKQKSIVLVYCFVEKRETDTRPTLPPPFFTTSKVFPFMFSTFQCYLVQAPGRQRKLALKFVHLLLLPLCLRTYGQSSSRRFFAKPCARHLVSCTCPMPPYGGKLPRSRSITRSSRC